MGGVNRFRVLHRESACLKFVRLVLVAPDRIDQPVVAAHREKVNAEACFPLDIGIGMRMLVQTSHHREKGRLVPMETAPCVKTDVRLSIFFPCGYRKQNRRNS